MAISAITTESETPPINRKSALKKHSTSRDSLGAATTTSTTTSPLQPSRQANTNAHHNSQKQQMMNDDKSEKAARRKSAHFGELQNHPDGRDRPTGGNTTKRVVSALAVQAQQQAQNGANNGAGGKRAKRLSAVAPAAAPVVSMEVMNTNFEEWMKLATDNKITANNTWNFALIDYFADLTLLRNDEDQSINFQKASCTLDGCVKIWTSRVDSVATETGKLLSGLSGGGGGEDADEEGADGEDDEEGAETRKTRKTTRSEATLAKSFATLQVKKFDLEFTVDPLFKKTCADFDEGGAMGLLMNHLSVDGKGRVVFDAGDAGVDDEDDEDLPEDETIDLTKIRTYMPALDKTMSLNISDTLQSFRFSSDPDSMPDFATLVGLKDSYSDDIPIDDEFQHVPTGETQDFFGDEDFDVGMGGGGGGFDDGASVGGYEDNEEVYGGGGVGMAGPGDSHLPFDPRRQGQGELVMALIGGGGEEEGMFDYFDKGFGKSWAGAEHWKLRKVSRKDPAATTTSKTTKVQKQPFQIDFLSPATASSSSKTLFAPATRSSISLPSSSSSKAPRRSNKKSTGDSKKRREEWLLPDDMHFSSRQLLRLFLKPKFALRMRKNAQSTRFAENTNGEIDENFWAQAAADRADFDDDGGEGDGNMPIPFESQFFHDDADDAFVDDNLDLDLDTATIDGGGGDEDDLWQGTQGQEIKKAKPENVNFAKKAKRVDVKRLKDDIWSGLKVLVPDHPKDKGKDKEEDTEKDSEDEVEQPITPTGVEEVKTFDSVIQNLRTTYPTEKMSEISTSFCFICLLHLANEEGLRIETARYDGMDNEDVGCLGTANVDQYTVEEDDPAAKWRGKRRLDEGERTDRVVGELQALKVFKDPTAGRAA